MRGEIRGTAPDCRFCAGSRRSSFCCVFLALLIFTSLRPDARRRRRDPYARAGAVVLRTRSAGGDLECPGQPTLFIAACCWSLVILRAYAVSGALLLRLDLPDGNAAALRRQHAVGGKARQAADRVEPLQALADRQVCGVDRGAGGGVLRVDGDRAGSIRSACWSVPLGWRCCRRSILRLRAVLSPLEHSHVACDQGNGRDAARGPAGHRSRFSPGALFAGPGAGDAVPRDSVGQPARHAVLVPGDLSAGRLLGAVSRWSILGLHKDAASCDKCNRCLLNCQGGDDPIGGVPWRKSECLMCMNCVGSCPHNSLSFQFFRKEKEVATPDLGPPQGFDGAGRGRRPWFR